MKARFHATLLGMFVLRKFAAEPHRSVNSVQGLRPGGRWFDPRLGHYSFRGYMIVSATGFIPVIVSTMLMWKSGQWLGRTIVKSTD